MNKRLIRKNAKIQFISFCAAVFLIILSVFSVIELKNTVPREKSNVSLSDYTPPSNVSAVEDSVSSTDDKSDNVIDIETMYQAGLSQLDKESRMKGNNSSFDPTSQSIASYYLAYNGLSYTYDENHYAYREYCINNQVLPGIYDCYKMTVYYKPCGMDWAFSHIDINPGAGKYLTYSELDSSLLDLKCSCFVTFDEEADTSQKGDINFNVKSITQEMINCNKFSGNMSYRYISDGKEIIQSSEYNAIYNYSNHSLIFMLDNPFAVPYGDEIESFTLYYNPTAQNWARKEGYNPSIQTSKFEYKSTTSENDKK